MKQNIITFTRYLTQGIQTQRKYQVAILVTAVTVVGGVFGYKQYMTHIDNQLAISSAPVSGSVRVATFGSSTDGYMGSGNSWPGELISLGSVSVQPSRDGTLAAWYVHVGERVSAGEVIGRLSPPPSMPDTVSMLAESSAMAAMAESDANAKREYAAQRLPQLEALRESTLIAKERSQEIVGSSTGKVSGLTMVDLKKQAVRAMLRESLAKTYPMLSGDNNLPERWENFRLKDSIGAQNSSLRDKFPGIFFSALRDINDPITLPAASGLAYFEAVVRLIDASVPDSAMMTNEEFVDLKTMLHTDQNAFIMALDDLKDAEMKLVETDKMYFEQLRMIDNDIAMLKQELAMVEGSVAAKQASFRVLRESIQGGETIVAPRGGVVSAISKRPGEFVGPGMPVAVVTGDDAAPFVRMRLPNDIRPPKIGEVLRVVRTGFPEDSYPAKLIGIGRAIDEGGAVMADAVLLEPVGWPVGASVRVLQPIASESHTVPVSALLWGADAKPSVWGVSSAGRVYRTPVVLGRTLGSEVEIYEGLVLGERYIPDPTLEIMEDMFVDEIIAPAAADSGNNDVSDPHAGHHM